MDEQQPSEGMSIGQLAHAGKTLQAIKQYRALNGATLDEARAAVAKL